MGTKFHSFGVADHEANTLNALESASQHFGEKMDNTPVNKAYKLGYGDALEDVAKGLNIKTREERSRE